MKPDHTRSRTLFTELRSYEDKIRAKYDDPYGSDHWEYERERMADPEWVRLRDAFHAARQDEEATMPLGSPHSPLTGQEGDTQ